MTQTRTRIEVVRAHIVLQTSTGTRLWTTCENVNRTVLFLGRISVRRRAGG